MIRPGERRDQRLLEQTHVPGQHHEPDAMGLEYVGEFLFTRRLQLRFVPARRQIHRRNAVLPSASARMPASGTSEITTPTPRVERARGNCVRDGGEVAPFARTEHARGPVDCSWLRRLSSGLRRIVSTSRVVDRPTTSRHELDPRSDAQQHAALLGVEGFQRVVSALDVDVRTHPAKAGASRGVLRRS